MSAIPRNTPSIRGPGLTTVYSSLRGAGNQIRDPSSYEDVDYLPHFRATSTLNQKGQIIGTKRRQETILNDTDTARSGIHIQSKVGGLMDTPKQQRIRREKVAQYGNTRLIPSQILNPAGSESLANGSDRVPDPTSTNMNDVAMIRGVSRDEIERLMGRIRFLQAAQRRKGPGDTSHEAEIGHLQDQLKAYSRNFSSSQEPDGGEEDVVMGEGEEGGGKKEEKRDEGGGEDKGKEKESTPPPNKVSAILSSPVVIDEEEEEEKDPSSSSSSSPSPMYGSFISENTGMRKSARLIIRDKANAISVANVKKLNKDKIEKEKEKKIIPPRRKSGSIPSKDEVIRRRNKKIDESLSILSKKKIAEQRRAASEHYRERLRNRNYGILKEKKK